MCAYQHVCLYITCLPGAHRVQKRTLFPREPELQTAVDNRVGAGKGAWVHQERQMVLGAEHLSSSIKSFLTMRKAQRKSTKHLSFDSFVFCYFLIGNSFEQILKM